MAEVAVRGKCPWNICIGFSQWKFALNLEWDVGRTNPIATLGWVLAGSIMLPRLELEVGRKLEIDTF
jgi:hypothetical protein